MNLFIHNLPVIGVDESGRGPLAGPVVAGAVILSGPIEGVTDSKKINKKKLCFYEDQIKKQAVQWTVAQVDAQTIDKVNIRVATHMAMRAAIQQLDVDQAYCIIDGNSFDLDLPFSYENIIKGDGKYYEIAAASILAKCEHDRILNKMAEEYPMYGWDKNAGYPTKSHREAIKEHGPSPFHRRSFKLL